MVIIDSIIGLFQIPWFIIILIFLSYLIWSKFLNNGALSVKNVNHILDILAIFLFIFLALFGLLVLIATLSNTTTLNLDFPDLINAIPWFIGLFGTLVFIYFLMAYRNEKKVDIEGLERIFRDIFSFYLISFGVIIGLWLLTLVFPYRVFMNSYLAIPLFLLLASLSLAWSIITKTLFGNRAEEILKNTKSTLKFLSFILIGGVISLILVSIVTQGEFEEIEYKIYNAGDGNQISYIYGQIPLHVWSFGYGVPLVPIISINFEKEKIETNGYGSENFRMFGNHKREFLFSSYKDFERDYNPTLKFPGITDLQLKRGVLGIFYNKNNINKTYFKKISLYGVVNKTISEDNFYYKKEVYKEFCSDGRCNFKLQIRNNLNLPVRLQEDLITNLINMEDLEYSNCIIEDIKSSYKLSSNEVLRYETHECTNTDYCDILKIDNRTDIIKADFFLSDGVVLKRRIYISEPIDINFTLNLKC